MTLLNKSNHISLHTFSVYCLQESKTYENVAMPSNSGATGTQSSQQQNTAGPQRPAHAKEYNFLDIELKYGFLQVSFKHKNLICLGVYVYKQINAKIIRIGVLRNRKPITAFTVILKKFATFG